MPIAARANKGAFEGIKEDSPEWCLLRPFLGQKEYKKEQCTAEARKGSLTDEEELKGLEEARQAALEVAQEEDEKAEESPEAPQEVDLSANNQLGVWGNLVSLRAPVMGMISEGFADQ